jgi:hypothetical protein
MWTLLGVIQAITKFYSGDHMLIANLLEFHLILSALFLLRFNQVAKKQTSSVEPKKRQNISVEKVVHEVQLILQLRENKLVRLVIIFIYLNFNKNILFTLCTRTRVVVLFGLFASRKFCEILILQIVGVCSFN